MNALSNNTFHRGLFVESKFAARLAQPARIAAIVGVLLVANMVFVVSAISSDATQREAGLPAPTASLFDDQFASLDMDPSATPRKQTGGLVDIAFNPLLP